MRNVKWPQKLALAGGITAVALSAGAGLAHASGNPSAEQTGSQTAIQREAQPGAPDAQKDQPQPGADQGGKPDKPGKPHGGHRGGHGHHGPKLDEAALAQKLGVSQDKLHNALETVRQKHQDDKPKPGAEQGQPGQPHQKPSKEEMEAKKKQMDQELADALGIDVSKVTQAMDEMHQQHEAQEGDRGPDGPNGGPSANPSSGDQPAQTG
ncbi:hypothetical protein [Corynebacterium heidelbergense]|uniref:Uncharacterized protein n=1 Tax=Corynebacterium heidelbergense TaxID=2055947 RepID=A0A364VBR5_9CORY|nr:hypothetical protein [Corynebacterium heidelbergense]RAV34048.1 hypothetical protein CWC39_05235 [Corynebacterium heidelbergense]WCZ35632.1 hypothetical protein CHEID_00250 [Corynebacterium heidelbergense]